MFRRIFFAAAYGHDGRRGTWAASSCEAHLETAIRFIKEGGSRLEARRWDRAQQQLDGVVCAPAV
jgi:hypothetical protein